MNVGVPGVAATLLGAGSGRLKQKWKKQLEIPATRFSCVSSGSCRPKLGLCILASVFLGSVCLILVPLLIESTPTMASSASQSLSEPQAAAVQAVSRANQEFRARLYPLLVKQAGEKANLVLSSFSASSALAMTFLGAAGQTATQMQSGLALPEAPEKGYQELMGLLQANDNFTLATANRLFVHESYALLADYLERTRTHFGAEAENVDFGDETQARQAINGWVSKQTHDKIQDLIAPGVLTALTRLVLVNAVYFKGFWAHKFDVKNTRDLKFTLVDGETVNVPTMTISAEYRAISDKDLGATVLEMPYQGDRLSMVLFLSKKPEGFAAMEAKFASFDLVNLTFGRATKFDVALPKFKVATTHDLVAPLRDMGMNDMFNLDEADFSGITGTKDLSVSDVVQKAFIEVNEEGTEAAAATSVIMMTRAMIMTPRFVCDRPFLFAIRDNLTGMTLFSGRVMDPSKD